MMNAERQALVRAAVRRSSSPFVRLPGRPVSSVHHSEFIIQHFLPAMPRSTPLIPYPRPRRRRRDRSLKTLAPHGSPPPAPAGLTLVAVDALVVIGPEIEMNLLFDVSGTNLLNDVSTADPTKWTARYQGQKYLGTILQNVAPDTLYLQMAPAGAEAGTDVLAYSNAPSDVSDTQGRFLAAFVGFPL
jgi:hypothetical protein